jgi:hypothetical protein
MEFTKKELLGGVSSKTNTVNEQKESGKKDFTEMVSLLLHSRTQAHTLHLQTKSYAEHMALNGYYDGIGDLVDGLIESYQGKYSILKGYKQYPIEDYKDTTTTINYLKELCDKVCDLKNCCKDSYIQNQIDTVCELINSTLYKLRFLK